MKLCPLYGEARGRNARTRSFWKLGGTLVLLLLFSSHLLPVFAATSVGELRCEYLENPQGIDVEKPRLSWVMSSTKRGQRQTAYRVLVANSEAKLKADQGDVWDSGKVQSEQSIQVPYAGKPLASHGEYFWKVQVWDKDGKASGWSEPARWTMGLLQAAEWKAKWIGLDGEEKTNYLAGTDWIWFPEGEPEKSAPVGARYFRRTFIIPSGREIKRARLLMTADSECKAYFNGRDIGGRNNYRYVKDTDVTYRLEPGTNVVAVVARTTGSEPKPAGLVASLEIEFEGGEREVIATDEQWKTADKEISGWMDAAFDDAAWVTARKLGPVGMAPWGNVRSSEDRRLSARWLRKEFMVDKKVERATIYFSGLG